MKNSKLIKGTMSLAVLMGALGSTTAFADDSVTITNDSPAVTAPAASEEAGYIVIDTLPSINTDSEVAPLVHYDYNGPDFTLVKGEAAFTTRSGYGFTIEDDFGPDYNDIDVKFNVTGSAVSFIMAVVKYSDYAKDPAAVKANVAAYAVGGTQTVTAAGSNKSVSFLNLPYDTYVVVWKNTGSSTISFNSMNVGTSM